MCFQDIQIGRASRSNFYVVNLTTAVTQFLPPSPERTAIIIAPCNTGTMRVGINPLQSASEGFAIGTSGLPLIFTLKDHGDMVRKAWFGQGSTANYCQVIVTALPIIEGKELDGIKL